MLSQTRDAVSLGPCVVDGTYPAVEDFLIENADIAVFIDLPLGLLLWRVCRRSARNLWFGKVLWNGNQESLGQFLMWDPIWLHLIRTHTDLRSKSRHVEAVFIRSERPFIRIRSRKEFDSVVEAVAYADKPASDIVELLNPCL